MRVAEIETPALLVNADALEENIATMARALPGDRLRPHVKAHKCTSLARYQAAAGLGHDLLLANEVLDARRLGSLVATGVRITLAVDSAATIIAAAEAGVREVVIDVN